MKATSINANESMRAVRPIHHAIILDVLKVAQRPISSEMISIRCNLDYHQIARRLSELAKDDKVIYRDDIRATTNSGRSCGTWQLKTNQLEIF